MYIPTGMSNIEVLITVMLTNDIAHCLISVPSVVNYFTTHFTYTFNNNLHTNEIRYFIAIQI